MSRVHHDPGAGDPWAMREMSRDRRSRAERVAALSAGVSAETAAASGSAWTGEARVAFGEAVATTVPELAVLTDSLHATADVLAVYADAVARIKDEQESLERHRARLVDEPDNLSRSRHAATLELAAPGLAFEDSASRVEALDTEVRSVDRELADIQERWDGLVMRRVRADADCVAALHSRDVRGAIFTLLRSGDAALTSADLLRQLEHLSASDLLALATAHPELLRRMRGAPPPDVAAWWDRLSAHPEQQRRLIENLPLLMGALGGLPAKVRVAANRILATERIQSIRQQVQRLKKRGYGTDSALPYATQSAAAGYLNQLRPLQTELHYLERAARGDVQLYLYEREDGRIIEMFGDPHEADVLLTFLPGTNTTMESFYTSTDREGITALTRWQVENALTKDSVAGFVVKQGEFPQLGDLWSKGPHHNWFADPLGREYAKLAAELNVVTGGTPIVSGEHSFGSAAGGEAERRGAHFSARFALGGIGMKEGWEAREGTLYYAAQGPADINRNLDDHEVLGLGYDIPPNAQAGFTEIATGLPGVEWVAPLSVLSPPVGLITGVYIGVDQHNELLIADLETNGPVMRSLQLALHEAPG